MHGSLFRFYGGSYVKVLPGSFACRRLCHEAHTLLQNGMREGERIRPKRQFALLRALAAVAHIAVNGVRNARRLHTDLVASARVQLDLRKGQGIRLFEDTVIEGGELGAVVSVLDYLLPEGPIIRVFDKNDNMVEEHTSDSDFFDYPIAVITNSGTASAAELFTSALRDYERSVTVGNTTYGKGCMQAIHPLGDGSALRVTYRMYKPPFSDSYHGIGIVPDVTVDLDPSLDSISFFKWTDEEDNQLEVAVGELIKFAAAAK